MRLMVASRVHEAQALTPKMITMADASAMITVFKSVPTEKRFILRNPLNARLPFYGNLVKAA